MKAVKNIEEVITLREQIDQEIENGNFEKVNLLTQTLCELQGLDANQEMPKLFVLGIKTKERIESSMNMKRNISKVAALLLVLGFSGGVVHGASEYFKNVEHMKYGLTTNNKYIDTETVNKSIENNKLSDDNEEIQIISTEKGDGNVLWETKEVRQEASIGYISDDGIEWKESTPDIVDITEYSYKNYSKAIKDTGFKGLFTKSFEQEGYSIYTQYRRGVTNGNDRDNLISNFKYSNGSFKVDESRVLDWDGTELDTVVISSSSEGVKNQREYISKNGHMFKLSDDNETGELRTTVLVSYDEYTAIITFFELSDNEIHEILDTIDIKK